MKIGELNISGPTVMAPLAGITNLPFRKIVKEAGADLVCSEMISAAGLVYNSGKTYRLLDICPEEKPVSVQIFGSKPDLMAEAAKIIAHAGADILDINFGCSVKKVIKTGSGAALMKDPENAENILTEVRKAIAIPLTIKIRSGWDGTFDQAFHIHKIAEDCGVDAITVHPRTAKQGFRGVSDWRLIREMKEKSRIPVIGNGDIVTPEDALKMLTDTGCDGIMIGRAAIGNPLLFSEINALLKNKEKIEIDLDTRFDMMIRYLKASVSYIGEVHGPIMMRSRLNWFVKGLPGSSAFRKSLTTISSEQEALDLITTFRASVKGKLDT